METAFVIPARPWTDADVAMLTRNANFLPEDIRAELGIAPIVPDETFRADFDAANSSQPEEVSAVVGEQATAQVTEQEELTEVVTADYKILSPIPFTDEQGEEKGNLEVDSIQNVPKDLGDSWVAQGLAEAVVNNETTDNV